jgi:3-isopropylmalate/(R)-2-methylmalate dehydratase small subunit
VKISGQAFVLAQENIDTDQIIPARFLTTTTRLGLGAFAFYDWRYASDGSAKADFALNQSKLDRVLVAGRNIGCGSSREHAPWALLDAGIKAVVASEIADIFRNNSLKNGLLPCVIDGQDFASLMQELVASPQSHRPGDTAGIPEIKIDVPAQLVIFPSGKTAAFALAPFAKHCLINGVDEMGYLRAQEPQIAAFEARYGAAL